MRDTRGRLVPVNGRSAYVEESGHGDTTVVFEAGAGAGRTCWDPVLPLLADSAWLIAYDRAGRVRTGTSVVDLSIDSMADDLVALIEEVTPGPLILVGHSMGGLVVRRAAERLSPGLRGLLLIDPTPETSPIYDNWGERMAKADRMLAWAQRLSRFRPVRNLLTMNLRQGFAAETVEAIRDEDATPAGTAQTRREMQATIVAIEQFRQRPPAPPTCPVVLLAAARPTKQAPHQIAVVTAGQEHNRRYAESLPDGRFESVDSAHLMQAEQPQVIADRILELLQTADCTN